MTDLTNLNKHVRAPSLDFLGMRLPTFASYFSLKKYKKGGFSIPYSYGQNSCKSLSTSFST